MSEICIFITGLVLGGFVGFVVASALASNKLERSYCIRTIYWLLDQIEAGRRDISDVKKAIEEGKFDL
jgi:hypothetical protein